MTTSQELAQLVRLTATAVEQQMEAGIDRLAMPGGLDALLRMPAVRTARPVVPLSSAPATTLETLYDETHTCTNCALGHKRQHFVFGSGNPHADVMFIGEAPGADEDAKGLPFVGAAGQLLTKILQAINFTRDDIYIANILKCRPPNNRDPQPEEIAACDRILKAQIRLIQPQIICALGRIAAQTLLGTTASVSMLRGRFHDYHGTRLLVTYHPSALLRDPAFKRPTWEDVQLLRREYDRINESMNQ